MRAGPVPWDESWHCPPPPEKEYCSYPGTLSGAEWARYVFDDRHNGWLFRHGGVDYNAAHALCVAVPLSPYVEQGLCATLPPPVVPRGLWVPAWVLHVESVFKHDLIWERADALSVLRAVLRDATARAATFSLYALYANGGYNDRRRFAEGARAIAAAPPLPSP